MNKTKNLFILELEVKLQKFDFKYFKKFNGFIRKEKEGWKLYQILFIKRGNEYELKPTVLIRRNEVENIYHKISGFEKKYQNGTPTIGIPLENIVIDKELNKTLNNENDIESLVNYYYKIFLEIALPFFDKNYTLESMYNLLNNEKGDLYSGEIFRGCKLMILSKLLELNNYDSLKKKYLTHYSEFSNGFYLSIYNLLIEVLNNFKK